jgi:hypothetical protein
LRDGAGGDLSTVSHIVNLADDIAPPWREAASMGYNLELKVFCRQ